MGSEKRKTADLRKKSDFAWRKSARSLGSKCKKTRLWLELYLEPMERVWWLQMSFSPAWALRALPKFLNCFAGPLWDDKKAEKKGRKETRETATHCQQVLDAGRRRVNKNNAGTALNYLKPIVGPRSKLEQAELFVEREVSDVHFTRAE